MGSIVAFHSNGFETSGEPHDLEQVGGKGLSLVTMARAGMPVPDGVILTVQFFEPWVAALQATPQWAALLRAGADRLAGPSQALQALCAGLSFTHDQRAELEAALHALREANGDTLYAVRSSSPEEDLDAASFAGGYETTLGVTRDGLEAAIRTVRCLRVRRARLPLQAGTWHPLGPAPDRGDRSATGPCDERRGRLFAQSAQQLLRRGGHQREPRPRRIDRVWSGHAGRLRGRQAGAAGDRRADRRQRGGHHSQRRRGHLAHVPRASRRAGDHRGGGHPDRGPAGPDRSPLSEAG